MANVRYSAPAQPLQVTLEYELSRGGTETFIARTGTKPPEVISVDFTLTELPPDLRSRLAAIRHYPDLAWQFIQQGMRSRPYLDEETGDPKVLIQAWETHVQAMRKRADEASARQKEEEAEEARLRRLFESAREDWIKREGSTALRLAADRDYNITSNYVRERASKEYPGFSLDANKKAKWSERANPTPVALAVETQTLVIADALGELGGFVRIAWLTKDSDGNSVGGESFPGKAKGAEAVLVEEYLQRYTLIKIVSGSPRK